MEKGLVQATEKTVEAAFSSIDILERLIKEKLKDGVDYYSKLFPGQTKPVLGDSGAIVIMNVFNLRPVYKLLEHVVEGREGEERIRYVIGTELISRMDGTGVSEGVGSATSDEVKYKYRWVEEDVLREEYGYNDEELEKLKKQMRTLHRDGKPVKVWFYQVRNPEILDLDNTILKMAAKRSLVDAVMGLPGVSRVFTQDLGERKRPPSHKSLEELAQTGKTE